MLLPRGYARQVEALRRALRDLGYIEGKNVLIEFRWADGNASRLPELANELVRLNPDVIVTSGPGTAVAKSNAEMISYAICHQRVSDESRSSNLGGSGHGGSGRIAK